MAEQKKLVILDPGHGGKDPGAMGGGMREASAVLMLVQYEAQLWREIGVEVVLTRDSDSTVALTARTALENKLRPACFISHHMDAAPISDGSQSTTACGATVWLHSKAPQLYVDWAADVLQGITKVGLSSNRAKDIQKGHRDGPNYNYAVNGNTMGPSMLLELGFVSSPANRAEYQRSYKDYARAIVRGTCKFLGWDSSALDDTMPDEDMTALVTENKQLTEQLATTTRRLAEATAAQQRMHNDIAALAAKYNA